MAWRIWCGAGALFLVDAVTSLGGHESCVDDWGIDGRHAEVPELSAWSITGELWRARLADGCPKSKPQSWYLDVSMLRKYYLAGAGAGEAACITTPRPST